MFVFLANFLPLYLLMYFSIFIFQLSCIRWVTLGCDRRTPVPTRPCPYNPSYQLSPLLLTQPRLPQVGWPYNLLVARLRLLVPGSPSQSSVGQTQGTWCMSITQCNVCHAHEQNTSSDTHGTHRTHLWVYSCWPTLCNTLQGRHHIASPWHWPPLEIEDTCSGNMNPSMNFSEVL